MLWFGKTNSLPVVIVVIANRSREAESHGLNRIRAVPTLSEAVVPDP
jgi:hypothetical protein